MDSTELIQHLAKDAALKIINDDSNAVRNRFYEQIDFKQSNKIGGSPSVADLNYLALLCGKIQPSIVFEIGTWIGTSATIISSYCRRVYTCDIQNVYKGTMPNVRFIQAQSRNAVDYFVDAIDFCFIDAHLYLGESIKIWHKFCGEPIIAIHDYNMHQGMENVADFIMTKQNMCLFTPAVCKIKGIEINSCIALITTRKAYEEVLMV